MEEALIEGAILTVLVVFLFLNSWRSTVITGLALPVSVLASFIAVWVLGFKLETMSLLGLSLAIGILIDDAIVVRENIVRHVEMGKDHYTASREGTDEIGLAVAATTFSILAVFVPIAFMPGVGGQWFKPFALTIACSVLVSLFVSFSLDPMLSAYWADPHVPEEKKAWITKKLDRFNHWFNRQADNYRGVIAWALDHRAAMVALAIGTFFASFTAVQRRAHRADGRASAASALLVYALTHKSVPLVGRLAHRPARRGDLRRQFRPASPRRSSRRSRTVGVGFFPEDDRSEFIVNLETPPGSNLAYTRLKAQEAARITRAHPEVRYTYTTLGGGASGTVDEGNIYVRLTPKNERKRSAEEMAQVLRDEMKNVAGVKLSVFTNDFGGGRKQLQFQLKGNDIVALNQAAEQVQQIVLATPGAVDVESLDQGTEAGARGRPQPRRRRLARRDRGAGGAVAAAGVRRHRCRRLGGSDRRDARRRGAARPRVASQRRRPAPASARRDGSERRADDDAARSGGDDQAGHRAGDHRSPRSRSRRLRRGEQLGPRDGRRDERRGGARHEAHAATGRAVRRWAATRRRRTRCSGRSSPRWASRSD